MASIVTGSQSGGEGAAAVPPEWASEIALGARTAACDVAIPGVPRGRGEGTPLVERIRVMTRRA
jgi:hypothetical protein